MSLRVRYQYEVFPEGLLPRFIVRTRALNQGPKLRRWRTGVELSMRDARALVRADVGERRIEIAVTGEQVERRRLLGVVRADFKELHTSIAKLKVSEEVGWCGAWLSYSELQAFKQAGQTVVRLINGEIVNVDVLTLLDEIETPFDDRQSPNETGAWNVALSYAHSDESLRRQLASYLKILERENLLRVWYDRQILAGDRVHEEISNKFQHADMVLLLVSADFLASDYCHDVEMNACLSRHQRGETVVIPIIVRECPWRTGVLGAFSALPRDGKAVTSWRIREEAWTDVAKGIEALVRDRPRPSSTPDG